MRSVTAHGLAVKSGTALLALGLLSLGALARAAAERTSLNLALEDSIRSFDPRQSVDANSQYIEDLIHCSLMSFDAEGRPIPGLAAKAPQWKSAKVLEVQVKDSVKFSDGSSVTPADVVATYQSLISDKTLARSASFSQVTSVTAAGNTVSFTLKEADASFVSNLVVGILPAKLTKVAGFDPLTSASCGPYRIKSTDVNSLTLEENPHYAGPVKLRLKQIEVKIVKNEKTRFAKLQTGELDLVQNSISRDALKGIEKKSPQLDVLKRPGLKTTYLGFNVRDKIAGNLAVREAIAYAINRQEIIDIILGGMATPATTLLPADSPFYDKTLKNRTLDLAKAEALLEAAGFKKKGDYRLELSYKTTTDVTRISIAKAIASQLKKVGIKITVEPMEWGRFKQDVDAGRVQLWSLTWVGFKDPDIYRHAFASSSFPPNGGNRGWYNNPKLDEVLEKGKITSNPEQRIKIYQDVQQLVDKDLPYIFLWHEDNFAVVNRSLKGFSLYADGRYSALTQAFFAQ